MLLITPCVPLLFGVSVQIAVIGRIDYANGIYSILVFCQKKKKKKKKVNDREKFQNPNLVPTIN